MLLEERRNLLSNFLFTLQYALTSSSIPSKIFSNIVIRYESGRISLAERVASVEKWKSTIIDWNEFPYRVSVWRVKLFPHCSVPLQRLVAGLHIGAPIGSEWRARVSVGQSEGTFRPRCTVTCLIPHYRRSSSHSAKKVRRGAPVRTFSAWAAWEIVWIHELLTPYHSTRKLESPVYKTVRAFQVEGTRTTPIVSGRVSENFNFNRASAACVCVRRLDCTV